MRVQVQVGDVAAPSWVLPVGVVVVTLGSILSGYLLKPGTGATSGPFKPALPSTLASHALPDQHVICRRSPANFVTWDPMGWDKKLSCLPFHGDPVRCEAVST